MRPPEQTNVSTAIGGLDTLLGGGLRRGTSTALIGPPGCGKSTLACHLALAATQRNERVVYYLWDELVETFRARAASQGLDIDTPIATGQFSLRQVEVAELTPGELAHDVAREVTERQARLIVLDSLSGLVQAMPDERLLGRHLHEILALTSANGALSVVTLAQSEPTLQPEVLGVDLSYLADTVIAQRYFEAYGRLRYASSVMKKRYGDHERTIREYQIGSGGFCLGEPLSDFRGILTGTPEYVGESKPLL